MTLADAQHLDQLQRLREISNIVEAIDDTQRSSWVYERLSEVVDQALTAQEQLIDGMEVTQNANICD